MYLSNIEIFGFKSFAQKTKLKFSDGLSAIVGPNGCGKTNIVDALRWVLGEKKASTLRSDVMENVIFNGNKERKPLGLAEVSVVFENTKGTLSSEYNEIEITRRLYRSGDSEYLINKSVCRLKDILDLFMDTGIGSDSYSVIELKMVESILSGKVDDRRAMFEEAAGIKKYKARRKETSKKLELISQDMIRLNDILLEVRKNVNSLSRQASKTKRYNQLLSELREVEINSLTFDYKDLNSKIILIDNELKKSIEARTDLENLIIIQNNDLHNLKERISKFDIDFVEVSNLENSLQNKIADIKKNNAIAEERIKSYAESGLRLNREIIEIESNNTELNKSNTGLKANLTELNLELQSTQSKKSSIESEYIKSIDAIKIERMQSADANSELNTLEIKIENIKHYINRNNDKVKQLDRKIQQNAEDAINIKSMSLQLDEDIIDANRSKSDSHELINEKEMQLRVAQEKKQLLENQISNLKVRLNDKKAILSSKNATMEFLNSLVDSSEVSKFLNNDSSWRLDKEKVILGEALGVDDKFGNAVVSALGEAAHSFVVDNYDEALSAINSLKNAKKGKSGFVVLHNIPEIAAPTPIQTNENVFGWISEIIRADKTLVNAVRGFTGKTLIVANKETAINLINENICDTAVTLEGELYNKNAYIYGGSISQKEGLWIGKKEKIEILKKEIIELKEKIQEINSHLEDLNFELNEIDIVAINNELNILQQNLTNIVKKIDQLELKKDSLDNNLDMLDSMKLDLENQLGEIHSENNVLSDQLAQFDLLVKESRTKADMLRVKVTELENASQLTTSKLKETEFKEIELKNRLLNINNQLSANDNLILKNNSKIDTKHKEIHDFDKMAQKLKFDNSQFELQLKGLTIEYNESQNKRQLISEQIIVLKEQFDNSEKATTELRMDFDKLNQAIHNLELIRTQHEANLKIFNQRLADEFQTNPEQVKLPLEKEFDFASAKILIADLRSKLNLLGSVNFMALEEYETQNERLVFYEKQMEDLSESQKILAQTIEEINLNAEIKFQETFDKIKENFKVLFKKLFGEDGEADLELESDDLLESDIKIIAKPPNKKPHSIGMLSGGEKTLSAIALLFAIYLVKPSPFCILDEVDAPLDDKNIDKFIGMIKDFSLETQFLIVTHNKKTMEAANTLYGVTMQEDGVSKVVAVKLKSDAA